MNERFYIRFGEIPENGKSQIFFHSIHVGYEIGVSVYDAIQLDGVWRLIYPNPSNCNTLATFESYAGGQGPGEAYSGPVYVVTGTRVGTGCDGEPLLTNIKIIEDITGKIVYNHHDDTAEIIAKTINPETGNTFYDDGVEELLKKEGKSNVFE